MLLSQNWRTPILFLVVLCVALATSLLIPSVRRFVRSVVPDLWIVHINGFRLGYRADYDVRISMPDGVELAAGRALRLGPAHRAGAAHEVSTARADDVRAHAGMKGTLCSTGTRLHERQAS